MARKTLLFLGLFYKLLEDTEEGETVMVLNQGQKFTIKKGKGDIFAMKGGNLEKPMKGNAQCLVSAIAKCGRGH